MSCAAPVRSQRAGIFGPGRQRPRLIGQSPVPLLQDKRCCFGLPLAAEDAFLVPDDTGEPCRHKSSEKKLKLTVGSRGARQVTQCRPGSILHVTDSGGSGDEVFFVWRLNL